MSLLLSSSLSSEISAVAVAGDDCDWDGDGCSGGVNDDDMGALDDNDAADGGKGDQGVRCVKANSISWSQLLALPLPLPLPAPPPTESLLDWAYDWACNSHMILFNMAHA